MNILLVDDHVSFCEGLIAAIHTKDPSISISFESDAELVPPSLVGNSKFDLIIVDIMMPGIGGAELIKHLNAMGNFVPIVVMSSIDDIDEIQEVYSAGVLGFLPKYYSVEEIIEALNQCHGGEIHVPVKLIPHINLGKSGERRRSIRVSNQHSDNSLGSDDPQIKITKRQLEILSLMDRGLSNQEMARALHISLATVKTHIQHLYTAFNVNNRVNCLRAAKKHRLR